MRNSDRRGTVFEAVLVANRGEIALRVIRACRELGVRSVAVYSDADLDARHVRLADEAYRLGPAPASESYLNVARILEVAQQARVAAIHPGYGFLSENADFADAVVDAGLVFIGPSPDAMRSMGDKLSAREVAIAADVPVVPGTDEPLTDPAEALSFGETHGYPIAVKAAYGGGGRGMRVVTSADEAVEAVGAAQREATTAFGRGEVYLERYIARPRHIEVQILGDLDGTVIQLGERDCSTQRRHQKLIEESPAPGLGEELRARIGDSAVRIAREVGYTNAGTCEFLLDEDGSFYFLEMNARLQVEHPVTELVCGIDLVHAQFRIASGDGMGITQHGVRRRGHAIEARINAEDPASGFMPTPGLITRFAAPEGPGVRVDAGVESGSEIPRVYDSLIAKVVVWAEDRERARRRLQRALSELIIEGVATTTPFHQFALDHPDFVAGRVSTVSVEKEWDLSSIPAQPAATSAGDDDRGAREVTIEVGGRRFDVRVHDGQAGALTAPSAGSSTGSSTGSPTRQARTRSKVSGPRAHQNPASEDVVAPMQGSVVKYAVEKGAQVVTGDLVVVLEAMKMENHINAHRDGVVTEIHFAPGDVVESGAVLAHIDELPSPELGSGTDT